MLFLILYKKVNLRKVAFLRRPVTTHPTSQVRASAMLLLLALNKLQVKEASRNIFVLFYVLIDKSVMKILTDTFRTTHIDQLQMSS